MIAGVGVDMVRIGRMEKSLGSEAFWQRVFGEEERAFLEKLAPTRRAASAATNFAAKEAFLKAAGTGLAGPFALREIQALRLPSGQPVYRFSGGSAQWMDQNRLRALLSLSHDGGAALAFCTLEPQAETCPAPPHRIEGDDC